jgi:DNA repair protein RecO (recombination protein O)
MMRIHLQPAYILHQRPYRETSLLLDVFTRDHGRLSLIARGVRKQKSLLRGILQLFNPLLISFQGKSELMTLSSAELNGAPSMLRGNCLLSGFYLNELLIRLLQKNDPYSQLYTVYQHTLLELHHVKLQQKTLRLFEKKLLAELGYGLQLDQAQLEADNYYRYFPEQGFVLCDKTETEPQYMIFSGKSLLAMATEQLDDETILKDAKRLMRLTLESLLGSQPLQSRKLKMFRKEGLSS